MKKLSLLLASLLVTSTIYLVLTVLTPQSTSTDILLLDDLKNTQVPQEITQDNQLQYKVDIQDVVPMAAGASVTQTPILTQMPSKQRSIPNETAAVTTVTEPAQTKIEDVKSTTEGETAKSESGLTITKIGAVNMTERIKLQVSSADYLIEDDTNYYQVNLTIKNIGQSSYNLTPYNFYLKNNTTGDTIEYAYTTVDAQGILESCSLLSKGTFKGCLVFETPNAVDTYTLYYENVLYTEKLAVDCGTKLDSFDTILYEDLTFTETDSIKEVFNKHNFNVQIHDVMTVAPTVYTNIPENCAYLHLYVTITNESLEPQYVSRTQFRLLQSDGILRDGIAKDCDLGKSLPALDLAHGESISGVISFVYDTNKATWLVYQPKMTDLELMSVLKIENLPK